MEAQSRDLRRIVKRAQGDHPEILPTSASAVTTSIPFASSSSVAALGGRTLESAEGGEEVAISLVVGDGEGEVDEGEGVGDYPWRRYIGGGEERASDSPTGTWRSSEA